MLHAVVFLLESNQYQLSDITVKVQDENKNAFPYSLTISN